MQGYLLKTNGENIVTNLFIKRKAVTVVDSIMGSGKTSWAIQYINESPMATKFIFITPYLTEIERIIELFCSTRTEW